MTKLMEAYQEKIYNKPDKEQIDFFKNFVIGKKIVSIHVSPKHVVPEYRMVSIVLDDGTYLPIDDIYIREIAGENVNE